MLYLWLKALHIISMVAWFSGIFYLPRLFVYHAQCTDEVSNARFKLMEKKLFFYITTPGAGFTLFFGIWMFRLNWTFYMHAMWMHFKLILVGLLLLYHIYLGRVVFIFKQNRNQHSPVYYRILNEMPLFFLVGIVLLVVLKPVFTR